MYKLLLKISLLCLILGNFGCNLGGKLSDDDKKLLKDKGDKALSDVDSKDKPKVEELLMKIVTDNFDYEGVWVTSQMSSLKSGDEDKCKKIRDNPDEMTAFEAQPKSGPMKEGTGQTKVQGTDDSNIPKQSEKGMPETRKDLKGMPDKLRKAAKDNEAEVKAHFANVNVHKFNACVENMKDAFSEYNNKVCDNLGNKSVAEKALYAKFSNDETVGKNCADMIEKYMSNIVKIYLNPKKVQKEEMGTDKPTGTGTPKTK